MKRIVQFASRCVAQTPADTRLAILGLGGTLALMALVLALSSCAETRRVWPASRRSMPARPHRAGRGVLALP